MYYVLNFEMTCKLTYQYRNQKPVDSKVSMQLWDIFEKLSITCHHRKKRGENTGKIHLQLLSQPNFDQRNTPANLRTIIQLGKT